MENDGKPTTVPTLTLSAHRRVDLMGLVRIVQAAREGKLLTGAERHSPDVAPRLRELEAAMREFELYEEAHR